MISVKTALEILNALPDVDVHDHFGSDAYRAHDRNFATVWHEDGEVNFRFSMAQQKEFLEGDGEAFAEIEGGWGRMGWTTAVLQNMDRGLFETAARAAWETSKTKYEMKKKPSKKKAAKKVAKKKPVRKVTKKVSKKKRSK